MDMTGYGRSTRPTAMNDVCNLAAEEQAELGERRCKPSYAQQLTTVGSDWDDIDAVVEYMRALRGVERVSLVGWSLGGPRAGGYAAQHADKVDKLVVLAPAYNRAMQPQAPSPSPAAGAAFNTQSHAEFVANWDRQVGCPEQYEQAASDAVWREMLASDPVGATWGQGVRRAPNTTVWGWGAAAVAKMRTPTLMVAADPRQAGGSCARARSLRRSRLRAEGAARSRLRVAQRDVGAQSLDSVSRVARMAHGRYRRRDEAGRREARLLSASIGLANASIESHRARIYRAAARKVPLQRS